MNEFAAQHPVVVVGLVKIAVLLFLLLTVLAYLVWFERKLSAHIQSRGSRDDIPNSPFDRPIAKSTPVGKVRRPRHQCSYCLSLATSDLI